MTEGRFGSRLAGGVALAGLLLAALVVAVLTAASGSSSAAAQARVADGTEYNPAFAPAPRAQSSGGNRSQPGEKWSGTAPVPDPLGTTGAADLHEFQVLSGFANDSLTVTIAWDAGTALAYDLDLYVQRLDGGNWVEVGRSTNGQALGDGESVESASVTSPPPGSYRARVVNWASTQIDYAGSIGFSVVKGPAPKVTSGRATQDRPDAALGPQLHAIYFVPSDGVDEALDTNGVIANAVAAMNLWFDAKTPGRHIRLDTYSGKTSGLDVSFVRGNQTAAQYAADPDGAFVAITDELEARGWTASPALKRYLVYYAGPAEDDNICGTAYASLTGSDFAQWSVVFLDANPGCGARDFGTPATGGGMSEAITTQELEHNEGMAPLPAPHQCWAFHLHICTAAAGAVLDTLDPESVDVMFPFVTFPLRDKALDPGHDDYYQHPFLHRDLSDSPFWEAG